MASEPEARVQLARLLGQPRLREASLEEVRLAVDAGLQDLLDGLISEASASDDVVDQDSALAFIYDRLRFLQPLLRDDQLHHLRQELTARVSKW